MPELRTVYFAPDGKFFDNREECSEYELCCEIADYIDDAFCGIQDQSFEIARKIIERYSIKERYDYKKPEIINADE